MEQEIERRRAEDKHDWWKTVISVLSAVLLALTSWALAALREQEHRMTTVEVQQKAIAAEADNFKEGIKEDIKELKQDVKKLLSRGGK